MPIIFEINEEYYNLGKFSDKLMDYIFEKRMGYSSTHAKCDNLTDDEKNSLMFSSINLVCWCSGEYKPKEGSKRKHTRQLEIFHNNMSKLSKIKFNILLLITMQI